MLDISILQEVKTMDAFDTSDMEESSGSKKNFLGEVTASAVDMDDADVDIDSGSDQYESDIDIVYAVNPLTEYEDTMYELGLNTSKSKVSKWFVLVCHLENIYGETLPELGVESKEDLCESLEGKAFEFRDITFDEDEVIESEVTGKSVDLQSFRDMENSPNSMMVPVREVTEDELAELDVDASDDEDVEEVEF
jgi:hypothetical protein